VASLGLLDGVKNINAFAFSDCVNLKSVVLPNSIISVGEGAFRNCRGLTNVKIPKSCLIGYDVFEGCSPDLKIIKY